jgi:hypothetical protein
VPMRVAAKSIASAWGSPDRQTTTRLAITVS